MKKLLSIICISAVSMASYAQTTIPAASKPTAPVQTVPAKPVTPTTSPVNTVQAVPATPPPVQNATPAPENPNAPELKLVTDNHDFGTVQEGPQAKFDFDFTNEGKEPLILQNVQASCGCTTPEWPKEPIMPGKKAKITAIYNTQGRPGPFTKTITVTSNAKTPTKTLTIRGTVEPKPAQAAPEKAPNMIAAPVEKTK
jgi:hypothetical protein